MTAADDPAGIARETQDIADPPGDAADQAERLSMVMEAEAIRSALSGDGAGEGSLEGYARPLEDTEAVLALEDAEDASDDPMHAGGLQPATWLPAEQAAMHVIDPDNPQDPLDGRYADELIDDANPSVDPYDRPGPSLTAEDETLLGLDPYEERQEDPYG